MELALRLAAGVLLIGANAFFVAVEFALTRLPDLDIDPDEVDSPGIERAMEMLDRLEIHLTGCQLGISTSSILLGVITEPAVTRLIEPVVAFVGITGGSVRGVSVVVAVVALNVIHKIWGEQAPTYLGVERPEAVAARLAPVLSIWSRIMSPIILFGDSIAKGTLRLFGVEITRSWTEVEVGEGSPEEPGDATDEPREERVRGRRDLKRRMARLLASSGDVPEDRQEEVMHALEIGEIPARRVMVPADEMVPLALDVPSEENRRRLARSGFVRYPVVTTDRKDAGQKDPGREDTSREDTDRGDTGRSDRDRIAGVVYLPRLFNPPERLMGDDLGLKDLLEDPVFLPADMPVADLIDALQEAGQEVAILTDGEDGNDVVGMVTVTDALEAIAGEVSDPLDPAEPPDG